MSTPPQVANCDPLFHNQKHKHNCPTRLKKNDLEKGKKRGAVQSQQK